ncbi:MAG: hypothetical protein ACLGIN_00230 [Candidatus Sericytochromatia bacterium]
MLHWSFNLNPNRFCPELSLPALESGADAALAQLADLGATGVRVDLFWHWLMPAPGVVNHAAVRWYRDFFAEVDRRGWGVFALLYHPPAWAMALLERDEAAFVAAWEDFCRLVAKELGPLLSVVQVWNEPNNFLASLKADPVLFHTRRVAGKNVPTGVRWETLASLFRVAKSTLPAHALVTYNVLTNLSPFLPFRGTWLNWEHFTDRFMAMAGDAVDVIALDHYPDTWAPGTGPLEWACLDVAAAKVADPASSWHGKTVIVGEAGYSNAPNFHLIERPFKWGRFFPNERSEDSMAGWYAAAMSHLAATLTPERFPANKLFMANVYELYDAPQPVGSHPALALEDHFGLVRRDGARKPAFEVMQAITCGDRFDPAAAPAANPPGYWKVAEFGQRFQARAGEWVERVVAQEKVQSSTFKVQS